MLLDMIPVAKLVNATSPKPFTSNKVQAKIVVETEITAAITKRAQGIVKGIQQDIFLSAKKLIGF